MRLQYSDEVIANKTVQSNKTTTTITTTAAPIATAESIAHTSSHQHQQNSSLMANQIAVLPFCFFCGQMYHSPEHLMNHKILCDIKYYKDPKNHEIRKRLIENIGLTTVDLIANRLIDLKLDERIGDYILKQQEQRKQLIEMGATVDDLLDLNTDSEFPSNLLEPTISPNMNVIPRSDTSGLQSLSSKDIEEMISPEDTHKMVSSNEPPKVHQNILDLYQPQQVLSTLSNASSNECDPEPISQKLS